MDFLYYRPGESAQLPSELAYAFETKPISRQVIAHGPDGGSGMIFAGGGYHERPNRVGMYHEHQTWQTIPGSSFWLGWYTAELPHPRELLRSSPVPGQDVILGDGNQWTIPVAVVFVDGADGLLHRQVALPQRMALGSDGEWTVGSVVAKYAALYDVAKSWWDRDEGVTIAEATNWCCTALATNYRLCASEASILGLFDTDSYKQILDIVIDFDTLRRRQAEKKSEHFAILNSPAGNADSIQDSAQPSLTL